MAHQGRMWYCFERLLYGVRAELQLSVELLKVAQKVWFRWGRRRFRKILTRKGECLMEWVFWGNAQLSASWATVNKNGTGIGTLARSGIIVWIKGNQEPTKKKEFLEDIIYVSKTWRLITLETLASCEWETASFIHWSRIQRNETLPNFHPDIQVTCQKGCIKRA